MKPTKTHLDGDGDFRSPECVKLLDEADVVVTNPPFSLFREYVAQLVEHGKKFLIIGQINNCTYKEIFPLIKANKLWLGVTGYMTDMVFGVPEGAEVKQYDREKAAKMGYIGNYTRLGNTCWYTNLDHKRRHDNLVCVEKYDPAKYPKFDNYDAINVDKISNIPKDWDGVMGVPISFLDKYNPEQFEIVQFRKGEDGKDLAFTVEREREWCRTSGCSYEEFERKFPPVKMHGPGLMTSGQTKINGKSKYNRILIQKRKPSGENKMVDDEEVRVTELEGDGDFRSPECVKLLDEADVVVTNPPFSLFREYVAQLVEHGKKFLIIGQLNAVTYKEIFPLIKNNKVWLGWPDARDRIFGMPDDADISGSRQYVENGKKYAVVSTYWYTNLDHKKRHEKLVLTEKYDPAKYPKYDNYDAINVDKVNDIPKDWDGVMGVPITFLDKYNPEQFEIVQFRKGEDGKDLAFTVERERESGAVLPGARTKSSRGSSR